MRSWIFTLALLLAIQLLSLSSVEANPSSPQGCRAVNDDEFAVDARLPPTAFNGKYAGQCLVATTNRGIRLTDRSRVTKPRDLLKGPFLYVANFKHDMKFWIAEIPVHGIEQFIMQQEVDYRDIAFHHQLRVIMKVTDPIWLYPQKNQNSQPSQPPIEIRDFVITGYNLRVASAENLKFTMSRGMRGYFVQANIFSSMDDIREYETTGNRDFRQYRLQMDEATKADLIRWYVQKFDQLRESRVYKLHSYNCITELFNGFFAVRRFESDFEKKAFDWLTPEVSYPSAVLPRLQMLGLIEDPHTNRIANYRKEYAIRQLPEPLPPLKARPVPFSGN